MSCGPSLDTRPAINKDGGQTASSKKSQLNRLFGAELKGDYLSTCQKCLTLFAMEFLMYVDYQLD